MAKRLTHKRLDQKRLKLEKPQPLTQADRKEHKRLNLKRPTRTKQ